MDVGSAENAGAIFLPILNGGAKRRRPERRGHGQPE